MKTKSETRLVYKSIIQFLSEKYAFPQNIHIITFLHSKNSLIILLQCVNKRCFYKFSLCQFWLSVKLFYHYSLWNFSSHLNAFILSDFFLILSDKAFYIIIVVTVSANNTIAIFQNDESGHQRGYVIFPRSHSKWIKSGFKFYSIWFQQYFYGIYSINYNWIDYTLFTNPTDMICFFFFK